jgi:hypothetical protein
LRRVFKLDVSSRWFKAAGATIIAAAVAGRYVAKWRRERAVGFNAFGDMSPPVGRYFIGLDLAGPTAAKSRLCDMAVLDPILHCSFTKWSYKRDGAGIVPRAALGRSFFLAIDGPQGLAGEKNASMRECERIVNAPGKTPYMFPENGRPYSGLISSSVQLFFNLVMTGSRFRLLGMDGIGVHQANLAEVFPGGGWRVLSGSPLPAKRSLEGRQVRLKLLEAQGIEMLVADLPTSDQLDAAMAAWTAYLLSLGRTNIEGSPPVPDEETDVLREGFIVQPSSLSIGPKIDENEIVVPV